MKPIASFALSLSASGRLAPGFRISSKTMRPFSSSSNNVAMGRLFPEEINMIYDSKCNVCKLEIDFLAKRDAEKVNAGAPKLKMTDLEGETYDENDPANGGISYKEGMAAIHAVTADGKVIKGVPVFALAYEQVKLGWLFKITTWPILKQIVDVGYTIFAKYRTILTRGASVESLVKEYEAKKALREKMEDADCAACKSKEP